MKKFVFTVSILLFSFSFLHAQVRIKMKKENGVYTTPCKVNGLSLRFIFDTGASSVSISLSEAIFMLKNGYMEEADLHGTSFSQLANGDIIENTTLTIRELEIGGKIIKNIDAIIIHDLSAPLLLGQSAIQKLGRIELVGDELIIFNTVASSGNPCLEAKNLIEEAKNHNNNGLYSLSSDSYERAYNLCPEGFDCLSLCNMGYSYYQSDNYIPAIKYLELATSCVTDKDILVFIYNFLSLSYQEINDNSKAIFNSEKALSHSTSNSTKSSSHTFLAKLYVSQNKYNEARVHFSSSLYYRLADLNATFEDLINNKVTDQSVGETLWNISICDSFLHLDDESYKSALLSAMCGYEIAKNYMIKIYGAKPEMFGNKK